MAFYNQKGVLSTKEANSQSKYSDFLNSAQNPYENHRTPMDPGQGLLMPVSTP